MSDNNNTLPIRQWAEDDRPREKLILKGKSALTNAELLAIIIGSGSRNETALDLSKRILQQSANNLNTLCRLSLNQLKQFKGIGEVKAISIIAALELANRKAAAVKPAATKITSSQSIFELMQPLLGELQHEEFWVIFLNNANNILAKTQLSKGGITGTLVDVRLLYKMALELASTSIILCHNHPSGTLKPSDADKQITRKIKSAGENLDIKVLDHIIVTDGDWFSFADDGIL